jgi:hypothetical protein
MCEGFLSMTFPGEAKFRPSRPSQPTFYKVESGQWVIGFADTRQANVIAPFSEHGNPSCRFKCDP